MKLIQISYVLLAATIAAACSEADGFKGSTKAASIAKPAALDAEAVDAVPEPIAAPAVVEEGANPPPLPFPLPLPLPVSSSVASDDAILKKVCVEAVSYNPNEILCAIQESKNKSLWKNGGKWDPSHLKNKDAFWISPDLTINQNGTSFCPYVPNSPKTIYLSHFTVAEDQDISIEAIMDDEGTVRIWKDADSTQEVYKSGSAAKLNKTVHLAKGNYSYIMDATDTAQYAQGAIASVLDAKGTVLRQTDKSADWCIYRDQRNTDTADFVNKKSLCKPCMTGGM